MERFEGIILDMDGTITDTMPLWARVAPAIYRRYGLPMEGVEQVIRDMYFRSLTQSAQWFIQTFSLKEEPERIVDLARQVMAEAYRSDAVLKEGAADYLRERWQEGIPMCVATASDRELAREVLEKLGVMGYLRFVISCEELSTDKNHPEIFLEAARRMGTAPERTAVFEDSPHCLETAGKAGFIPVGFAEPVWEFARERMKAASRVYVSGFPELSRMTGRLGG